MKEITARKFLCRSLLEGIDPGQLRLVDLTGELPVVHPFRCETADTIFVDSRVVLMTREHAPVTPSTPSASVIACALDW